MCSSYWPAIVFFVASLCACQEQGSDAEPTCTDGSMNGDETDVDCGGDCPRCADGKDCQTPKDCSSNCCSEGTCVSTLLPSDATVLFVSDRDAPSDDPRRAEIYALSPDTGTITRLTNTSYSHFIFALDSSHRFIVASRSTADTTAPTGIGDEDRRSVWIIDLVNETETRLTDVANHAESRSFSPDSEWVVMCMKVAGEDQTDVYKIRRDGSSQTRLTDTLTAIECDPAWSHDGALIAYTYLDGLATDPRYVLRTMDSNGGNQTTVYDGGPGVSTSFPPGNFDPAWSRDDEWLVFERAAQYTSSSPENFGSGVWHILKAKSDGTTATAIDLSATGGHADRAEYLPSFSPDGTRVIYGSIYQATPLQDSHADVFVMDQNGGSVERLLTAPPNKSDKYPMWIP
ncbi:MAG: hypothetical protein V2A73_02840 [Pseudomonadota bacterium]